MSSGGSGAVQFQINKNNATQGIYFHREKPKSDQRKFGYKSKSLRHPIRQPDYEEELERVQKLADEEKRKFNKKNTDFIRKNRERYRPKENAGVPTPGSTQIAPGTVTLTQDQLAALLKTLGKTSHGDGNSDSPLRISIDAENNKIEVERYESDSNADNDESHSNHRQNNYDDKDDDNSSEVGIEAFLNNDSNVSKSNAKKTRTKDSRQHDRSGFRSRDSQGEMASVPKPQESTAGPERTSLKPDAAASRASVTRLSWDDAKKEAGVAHVPDIVPWRHLSVAERKRLQWARERAEVEDYNPWGQPGAGAPAQKQVEETKAESHQPDDWVTKGVSRAGRPENSTFKTDAVKSSNERKKEELANEILQLQLEIRAAEKKHQQEEENLKEQSPEKKNSRKPEPQQNKKGDGGRSQQRDRSNKREAKPKENTTEEEGKVQIVIINRKKDKAARSDKKSGDERDRKRRNDESAERSRDNKERADQKSSEHPTRSEVRDSEAAQDREKKPSKSAAETEAPAGRANSRVAPPGLNGDHEEANLSKKEIERRKWLAELDKQREEQRLKKQMEKERDRAGVQDQWADRFVYHKSPRQSSPRRAQYEAPQQSGVPNSTHVNRPLGQPAQAQAFDTMDNAPPAAMRSSMVVGDGSLNESRYDNKKAEEKRKWLQELEQQREEQRLARQVLKERDRQENNGTWADHYPTDRQKLNHDMPHHLGRHNQDTAAAAAGQAKGTSPRPASNSGGKIEAPGIEATATQRTNSAPYPPLATTAPATDESTTFLRGQAAFVDPVTRKEQEEKRRVHLEYQAQIKAQIEEKERQKREERERKVREDMEEERKLQMERDNFNKQLEQEQRKLREKEEQRQKQIDALKTAMDEAQEKAMEEKTHRRIHHLQTHGHDVTQLKATYDEPSVSLNRRSQQGFVHVGDAAFSNKNHENDANREATPRSKQFDASQIPGLGTDLGPQQNRSSSPGIQDFVDAPRFEPAKQDQGRARYPLGQSYTKEPYVEDRVLTPSRFRQSTLGLGDSGSPRREFGTQTLELSDLQNILNSLPEDIQIEYKHKVEDALRQKEQRARNQPTRKVYVKAVDDVDNKKAGKPPPAGAGGPGRRIVKEKPEPTGPKQRLAWNQKQRKTVLKNSERDPFYQQKKEQAEARRARRERQLQYLQELNSENIPTEHASRSKSRHEHCSPRREGEPEAVEHRGRKVANARARRDDSQDVQRRQRSHSPNVLSLVNTNSNEGAGRRQEGGGVRCGARSKSPAPRYPLSTGRSSPLIPTARHRMMADPNADRDPYLHANQQLRDSQSNTKYGDAAFLPVADGEFVPFMRTTEILDPARAEEPMAVSRENSRMERARKAYRETHNPAGIGRKVEIYQDREREAAIKTSQNPLMNPSLVTDHPTARQDMILQQLSSLKQTLMQRQRELETYMSPAELDAEAAKG